MTPAPRKSDFYELEDGAKVPRVTAILKAAFPFDNLNWSAYLARDNTRRYARQAYEATHPVTEGRQHCLGLDAESYSAVIERSQGNAPPHMAGQDAHEVGTAVHKYAEAIMRLRMGENVRVPTLPTQEIVGGVAVASRHQNAVDAFHAWLDAHKIEPLTSEVRLVSRQHGYAGTADMIARVDGIPTMVDFKTSKGIYLEYPVQVAAYKHAAIEMGLAEAPMAGLIARFPKEAGDTFELAEIPWDWQEFLFSMFLGARANWEYRQWFSRTFPYKRRPR